MLKNAYVMKQKPLVSAIMLTGHDAGRSALARLAVRCFERQTYEKREMVIMNTGQRLGMDSPNSHEILCAHPASLGELRNMALEHVRGDLLINWDDDDWFHPNRIAEQVTAYLPEHIVLLRRQIRLNLLTLEAVKAEWHYGIFGTMLWPKGERRFPSVNRGEDMLFVESFPGKRVVYRNDPSLYVRTYHGGNICTGDHIMSAKGCGGLEADQEAFLKNRILPEYREHGIIA